MDPISAAGIGLSVTSLCLQVFAGCIKGYELFSDAVDMPIKYATLKTRLRIEQSRLLNWGEQIGLLEDLLEEPSRSLLLHHNLVVEVLLEMHAAFRSCLKTTSKYDAFTAGEDEAPLGSSAKQSVFLKRARGIWRGTAQAGARLEWAMIRQGAFEGLVSRLVIFNDRMESFLDRSTIRELHLMQEKSNLLLVQLTEQVSQLQMLAESFQSKSEDGSLRQHGLSRSSTLVVESDAAEVSPFGSLASFKAQNLSIDEDHNSAGMLIEESKLKIGPSMSESGRIIGWFGDKAIWVEWRSVSDDDLDEKYHQLIQQRLSKLAYLLNTPKKPEGFRSPHCLGYCRHETEEGSGYGLVYESFAGSSSSLRAPPRTLRHHLTQSRTPSLSKRIELASKLAESLMYLHSVDWLHKGFQSDNILFFEPESKTPSDQGLLSPTISGFDFSRPDMSDETTIKSISRAQDDYYRHPDLLAGSRSSKTHDIYALGVVLAEIAMWKPVEAIMEVCLGKKLSRSQIPRIRERLLAGPYGDFENVLAAISAQAGDTYASATKRCLEDGTALGIELQANTKDTQSGSKLQEVFYDEVYMKLKSLAV